ncbi:hypothetical protein TRIUR3_31004 [Triticum urartu]|uniref:CCHC-type domain-containing protein n=1 Tax=Triticum urartu TaxID=4572 RepID=M7ZXV6_TRIUA|nr:hypothetical protein TRIUR3_31004 [Triticum urartu]
MAYYSDHHAYASNTTNSTESIQELISKISHQLDDLARQQGIVFEDRPSSYDPYSRGHPYVAPTCHICGFQGHSPVECQRCYSHPPDCFGMSFAQQHSSCQNNYTHGWPENQNMSYRNNNPEISPFASSNHMQGFRYNEESHNYAPQQFHSTPSHIPQYQEMCLMELNGPPFGQPTTPAPVVQSHVQVPTQDEFDDIDKLTLLSLEFTWSAEDDPIRKVILEEMKKIKSGKELVEEVRKIEKNINAGSNISSLLELSVDGISLKVCEVPTPSHPTEQDSKSPEEEIPQIEEDELEDEEQDDEELEFPSDQDEDKDLLLLKNYFPRASPMLNETYHSHASLELNDKYHPHVSVDLADFDHPKHVLYSYAYVIGYSIDDLEGIIPTTCIFSFVECSFRFLLVHESLHADQVRGDIPWDPGGS